MKALYRLAIGGKQSKHPTNDTNDNKQNTTTTDEQKEKLSLGLNISSASTTNNDTKPKQTSSSMSLGLLPSKGGGEIRQPTLSVVGNRSLANNNSNNHNNNFDNNNNNSNNCRNYDNVENLKINKNTINTRTNFNNPALTSRVGIDETLDTSRGRSEKPNVTINNIAAAANIMGETERKSLKLAAVENECSEILPYLFVSGEAVARNLKLLQSKGITDIINCAGVECKNYFENNFRYVTIKLSDSKTARIDRYIYAIINQVEAIRKNGGRVLIHCWQGVSRSVSFVVAYLMWQQNLTFENAKSTVRKVRNVARPNMGFQCQLMEWRRLRNETFEQLDSRLYALLYDKNITGISSNILPQLCLMENSTKSCVPQVKHLDPRGCFLLHTKGPITSNEEGEEMQQQKPCLYIWKGIECNSKVIEKMQEQINGICRNLMENEIGAKDAKVVYVGSMGDDDDVFSKNTEITYSKPSDEKHFWSCLGSDDTSDKSITKQVSYDTFWDATKALGVEMGSLETVNENLNNTASNDINNSTSDDGDDGEIALYKYTGAIEKFESDNKWEHLYGYEWEDLGDNNASEDIFLIANKSKAYLFIGAKCTYSFVKETPASIHACINDVILKAGDLSWTGKNIIVVMEQLGLSDEFCDFFELGM